MDAHSLAVLEFPPVRECLAREAGSVLGRQRAEGLVPSPDRELAAQRLAATSEGREFLRQGAMTGMERAADLRAALARAVIAGARLAPMELVAVAGTLEAAGDVRRAVRDCRAELPQLLRLAADLAPLPELARELRRCLTPD